MEFITDEMLFYAGIASAGCAFLMLIVYGCISQVKKIRLKACLDAEYGAHPKK